MRTLAVYQIAQHCNGFFLGLRADTRQTLKYKPFQNGPLLSWVTINVLGIAQPVQIMPVRQLMKACMAEGFRMIAAVK